METVDDVWLFSLLPHGGCSVSCPQTDNPGELTSQRPTGPAWPCFSRREGHAFSLMNDIPGSGNGVTFGVALPPQLTPEYPLYPLNTDPSPHRVSGRGFLPRPGSPPGPEGSPWACRSSGCGRQVHLWVGPGPTSPQRSQRRPSVVGGKDGLGKGVLGCCEARQLSPCPRAQARSPLLLSLGFSSWYPEWSQVDPLTSRFH